MVSEREKMSSLAVAIVVGALFAACGGGPSESEFVAGSSLGSAAISR